VRNSTVVGRVAAVAAVLIAVIAVAVIVLGGGTSYKVNATFQNASQIVSGDLVEVSGTGIGTVSSVALTPQGQANLTLNITNQDYRPLRLGTTATIRSVSLSGIANRYIDLRLGPGGAPTIKDGGTIPSTLTTSEVDLDQLFNTLDAPTRKGLQNVIQGSASQYEGSAQAAQLAFQYLNPAIATSSLLFSEINRDTSKFTNFIVKSANLVSDISQRSTDLSGLIGHLATTTQALAAQRAGLGEAIQRLPGFMALANTTFVNLRGALNDLTPLVNATKPVAPKLQKLLAQLQPLAQDSVPTVRDLSNIISRPGADNDLTELTALGVPLANATVRNVNANGKLRPGAFPVSTTSLNDSTPLLATLRPYAVDLTSWFDGFSHPGTQDGLGSASRTTTLIGGLTAAQLSQLNGQSVSQQLTTIPQLLTHGTTSGGGQLTAGQGDRCPGSLEPNALWYPETGFPCNPNNVPSGSGQ
jgi:phospholipid/cholesterol/gamma-HCH transport system substrate-binding protein